MLIEPFYTLCIPNPSQQDKNDFKLRPKTINFLNKISNSFEIFFFSSRKRQVLQKLTNELNRSPHLKKKISSKFFSGKECSITKSKKSIKDLFLVKNRHVKDIIFLDYKPESLAFNLGNLVLIPFWSGELEDEALDFYAGYLENLAKNDDCRPAILKDMDYRGVNELIDANEYVLG